MRDMPGEFRWKRLRRGEKDTSCRILESLRTWEAGILFGVRCAAKSGGKCLNDFITSGPALQNPLPAVVIGFRE
jgi:hypothetical protein